MLVDFSPWETADTSLRLSRKRPRNSSGAASTNKNDTRKQSLTSWDDYFPVVGSVVTTKASRRKKRAQMDSGRAIFTITSPHRVSILVEEKDKSNNAPFQESPKLQYTSRNAFVPEIQHDDKKKKHAKDQEELASIPVLYDAKNDRLFALQGSNTHLMVWDAQSEPPSDLNSKGSIKLKGKAVSLNVLPNGVVYGSCHDGSIFFANVEADSTWQVQYLPSVMDADDGIQHAGTLVEATPSGSKTATADGQNQGDANRKSIKQGEEGQAAIKLYQMFWVGNQLTLICRRVEFSIFPSLTLQQFDYKTATTPLLPPGIEEEKCVVRKAMLVPRTSGYQETVSIVFLIEASASWEAKSPCYGCTFLLATGNLAHPPFSLPSSLHNASMIGSRIMAYGTGRQVVLCDAFHGTVMHSEPLPPVLLEAASDEWTLYADDVRSRLLLLYNKQDQLRVATTAYRIGDDASLTSTAGLSLAARISASGGAETSTTLKLSCCLGSLLEHHDKKDIAVKNSVVEALDILRAAEAKILSDAKAVSFLEEYEKAVAVMVHSPEESQSSKGGVNGSISTGCRVSVEDGGYENGRKRGKLLNGFHGEHGGELAHDEAPQMSLKKVNGAAIVTPREHLVNGRRVSESSNSKSVELGSRPDSMPQCFVGGATAIVLRILQYANAKQKHSTRKADATKQDCTMVLSRLLATGKVSVRRHFLTDEVSDGVGFPRMLRNLEASQTDENPCYSPMDMMHDMLRFCEDVSERHMVMMLHYMLSQAYPSDIAMYLLGASHLPPSHPSKKLSERFLQLEKETPNYKQTGTGIQKKIESVTSKLVVAGSCDILESILLYSHCNQALLCSALRDGLSYGHESSLLSRLLSNLVFSHARARTEKCRKDQRQNIVASATIWFPALMDAFADRAWDDSSSSFSSMELVQLQENLTAAIRQTERLMALEDCINEASIALKQVKKKAKVKQRKEEEESLPAYSIERLAF